MLMDELGLLRADGTTPHVSATEIGSVTLTKDATTGKRVIQINKTGKDGIPVVCITGLDDGTSTDKTLVCTIEAANELAFNVTNEVVATFPTVTHGDAGKTMIRRVHTQKKYLRSVITLAGTNGTMVVDFTIFITEGLMNQNS